MKYSLLLFKAILSSFISSAQMPKDWDAFAQRIDAYSCQGKKFHFEPL